MSDGTTAEKPKGRKIAIVGTAPSSVELAPYHDPAWEVWVLKVWTCARWDVFFEIHEQTEGEKRWPKEYVEFLRKEHKASDGGLKPIITQGQVGDWPNSQPYPLEDVLRHYGQRVKPGPLCEYFTNQVSYMIALACMQKNVTDIGLWGVDMAQHGISGRSEYAYQRPSCEFFLGWAAGQGINVYIPPQSDLLKSRKLYAFERDQFSEKLKAREKELRKRAQNLEALVHNKTRELDHIRGALEDVTWQQQWEQVGSG